MTKIINKLNFILGIIFVIISIIPGKFLEHIARIVMTLVQTFFAYIPSPAGRGFIDIIWESFVLEAFSTGVYCSTAIFLPIIIFDKFFKKTKINWTPSIIFLLLFFSYFGYEMLKILFLAISDPNVGFTDILRVIILIIGYCVGFMTPLYYAYNYTKSK